MWEEKLGAADFLFLADPMAVACARWGVAKQLVVHNEWVNVPGAFVVDAEGILRYGKWGAAFNDRATAEEIVWAVGAANQ